MTHQTIPHTRRLRVAIVGTGVVGAIHFRSALRARADVVGVMASTAARGVRIAENWGVPHAFSSVDEVVASDADVVHIATPNSTHAHIAQAVMSAGKHVICEKPLGVSRAEAEAMEATAERQGIVATVPFVYRYHPLVREIRERITRGDLGQLHLLHGHYLQEWMLSAGAANWRVDPERGGPSRAFADIGSHWCDLVEWVSGEKFESVSARLSTLHATRPAVDVGGVREQVTTEDSATLMLRTRTGAMGSLVVSQAAPGRKNRLWFELDGTRASAVFDQENPDRIWIGRPAESRLVSRDPEHGASEQRRLSVLPAGHPQGYAECFEGFVRDTYAAIDGVRHQGLPTFADGVRAARIVDAVLDSNTSREWETIDAPSPFMSPAPKPGSDTLHHP